MVCIHFIFMLSTNEHKKYLTEIVRKPFCVIFWAGTVRIFVGKCYTCPLKLLQFLTKLLWKGVAPTTLSTNYICSGNCMRLTIYVHTCKYQTGGDSDT